MRHRTRATVAALLALPLVWIATSGVSTMAAPTTYGTLRGRVVDEQDQPLAGVVIKLSSPVAIRERGVVTDAQGAYFASQLEPGDYTVLASLDGFVSIQQDVTVKLDQVSLLDFKLPVGDKIETVRVTAEQPVVSQTQSKYSFNLRKDFTETLPLARSYQSLLQLSPAVANTGETVNGGNPNILGGSRNSNLYLLDGVSITDAVTGTFGSNFNFDSIQEISIELTNISAEYGRFAGGVANVITKSGGNEITGSLRDEITSPSFEKQYSAGAKNEFSTPPASVPPRGPRTLTHDIETSLGGPIVRDRAWFFLSYNRNDTAGTEQLGNPTGGVNSNGIYVDTFEGDNSFGKLTYQATNRHKIQVDYFEDPALSPRCYGEIFFGGPCYESYNLDNQQQGGFSWTTNWNAVWGAKYLMDLRVGHWENSFDISSFTPQPVRPDLIFESLGGLGSGLAAGPPATIDLVSGALFDGTIFAAVPEVRERDQADLKVTTFLNTESTGSHTIKVGVDYQEQMRTGASVISGNALIYMGLPNADPLLNTPGFVDSPPGIPDSGTGLVGDAYDIDNRVYYLFYDYAPPGTGGPKTTETALFVQDDWALSNHWAFNLGLRFEQYEDKNDVGEKVIDQSGFAPRLGATFDVGGDGKHLIKATAARYLQAINLATLSPFARAAGGQSAYDIYSNANFIPGDAAASAGVPDWTLVAQVRADPDTSGYSSDLEPMNIDELTVGYETALTPTWGIRGRLIHREWGNVVGRTFSFDYGTGTPRQILFYDNRSDLERTYRAAIVEVEKRWSENWDFRGNVTFSKAEGNFETEDGTTTYGQFPGVPQNVSSDFDGRLPWDVKTAVKLQGFYRVPLPSNRHGLQVGANFDWAAGNAYANNSTQSLVVGPGLDAIQDFPLGTSAAAASGSDDQAAPVPVFFEPRGSKQEPDVWYLDFLTRYLFEFNKKVNFEARFEIRNLTDEQSPTSVSIASGFPTSFGQLQKPRRYLVNMAMLW